jgi:hypothetical protein
MQKFILILSILAGLCFVIPASVADTNQVATNQIAISATSTNQASRHSDAELQTAARDVMHKIIIFGIVVLVGVVVVAGFALYGAYRKFGVVGAIIVGVILAFGALVFCGFLLIL